MYRLISYELCPFLQCSMILMNLKGINFKLEIIDKKNPPLWFKNMSPQNQMPILVVGTQVICDATGINEYLEEIQPPHLLPEDPLEKAIERGYIENATKCMHFYTKAIETKYEKQYYIFHRFMELNLKLLLSKYQGPYFSGDHFGLVDAYAAVFFYRFFAAREYLKPIEFTKSQELKLNNWSLLLMTDQTIRKSNPKNYRKRFREEVMENDGFLFEAMMTEEAA